MGKVLNLWRSPTLVDDSRTVELRICRYIAEHGSLWEWKPGVDWATEEQLLQCEAAGLVVVRWIAPNSHYPWSPVELTEAGKLLVGAQLFAELLLRGEPLPVN